MPTAALCPLTFLSLIMSAFSQSLSKLVPTEGQTNSKIWCANVPKSDRKSYEIPVLPKTRVILKSDVKSGLKALKSDLKSLNSGLESMKSDLKSLKSMKLDLNALGSGLKP